jgi:hypothetical protein
MKKFQHIQVLAQHNCVGYTLVKGATMLWREREKKEF